MDLIDTHCHLDLDAFDSDREAVIQRCREQGVNRIVIPAVDTEHWDKLLQLCRTQAGLYPALGLHPIYLDHHRSEHVTQLGERVATERPIAIGEIGLDFYIDDTDRERQQALFEAQLGVARDANLPVLLHVRKAHDQILTTLRRIRVRGGIAHAFNGSVQQAQQYLDLGFKLGFGGMLTYERSNKLRRLARELPLQGIVLETDAPDMTPVAHRGERNSPEYLPECLAALAEVRGETPDYLAAQTTRNATEVLGLA